MLARGVAEQMYDRVRDGRGIAEGFLREQVNDRRQLYKAEGSFDGQKDSVME